MLLKRAVALLFLSKTIDEAVDLPTKVIDECTLLVELTIGNAKASGKLLDVGGENLENALVISVVSNGGWQLLLKILLLCPNSADWYALGLVCHHTGVPSGPIQNIRLADNLAWQMRGWIGQRFKARCTEAEI